MDLVITIAIALSVGAIAFLMGWIFGCIKTNKKYKSIFLCIEKPSYFPEAEMRNKIVESLETTLIKEGAMGCYDDGEFKQKTVMIYLREDDKWEA